MTSFIDIVQEGDEVIVWERDDSHHLISHTEPAPYYLYHMDTTGTYKALDGSLCKLETFQTRTDYQTYRKSHDFLYESDISAPHKYLSDNYHDSIGPVHFGYYDIEVDYDLSRGEGYPSEENPYGEVTSISLYDRYKNKYVLMMLTQDKSLVFKDEDQGIPVECHHCATERQLLDTFRKAIEDIDILTAWNGDYYDLPYILARLAKHYNVNGYKMLCRGDHKIVEKEFTDQYGNQKHRYELVGRVHLDMLEVYRNPKFLGDMPTSFKLDNIAEVELGEHKRTYPGDLAELYRKDPKTFFDYSLHDTRLLKKLDDKLRLLDQIVALSREASIRFSEVMGSILYLEHAIRNYCHFNRAELIVLPDAKSDSEAQKFDGGFVLDTKAGIYEWTQSLDISSLYPSIIRAINISPETYRCQCLNGFEDFVAVVERSEKIITVQDMRDETEEDIPAWKIAEMLDELHLTISANGTIFENDHVGLIPEVLTRWYHHRKELKRKSHDYDAAGDKEKAEHYDLLQGVAKIGLNSLYGAISNPYSRFYNLDCAKSVTLSGQQIEKFQIRYADEVLGTMKKQDVSTLADGCVTKWNRGSRGDE